MTSYLGIQESRQTLDQNPTSYFPPRTLFAQYQVDFILEGMNQTLSPGVFCNL